ncbi:MAG: hypothetical protein ACXAEU_16200 [Candidatus Hodarchaeales archaeon]
MIQDPEWLILLAVIRYVLDGKNGHVFFLSGLILLLILVRVDSTGKDDCFGKLLDFSWFL